jgi:hypothetical protein
MSTTIAGSDSAVKARSGEVLSEYEWEFVLQVVKAATPEAYRKRVLYALWRAIDAIMVRRWEEHFYANLAVLDQGDAHA